MKRRSWFLLATLAFACERDEVVVWSSGAGGAGGSSGSAGTAGSGGSEAGSAGTSGSAGTAGTAGTESAGTAGGGGAAGAEEPAEMGGGAGESGTTCTDSSECPAFWTCEKASCSDETGVCEPRPVFCPPEPIPVCGCDHVTYWNDCVRRQSGASAARGNGECRSGARTCSTGDDCGVPNASCARIFPPIPDPGAFCNPAAPGVCWVVPARCEPSADPLRWRECAPYGGEPPPCVDTCGAIVSERPHIPPRHGDACF
jgi:hypothetical protein